MLSPGFWWQISVRTGVPTIFHFWKDGSGELVGQVMGQQGQIDVDNIVLDPERYLWLPVLTVPRSVLYEHRHKDTAYAVRLEELTRASLPMLVDLARELGIDTQGVTAIGRLRNMILRHEGFRKPKTLKESVLD